MKRRAHKEMRVFYLNQPILDVMKGNTLLEDGVPIYGIFHFKEEGLLDKVVSYDMDGRRIQIAFANILNSSEELPFNSQEEIEAEIGRIRREEVNIPKIAVAGTGGLNDAFAKQASLLRRTREVYQFQVVWSKFQKEENK